MSNKPMSNTNPTSTEALCRHVTVVIDNGQYTCISCGQVGAKALDQKVFSFNHGVCRPLHIKTYTRAKRFSKIVSSVVNRENVPIDDSLLKVLKGGIEPENVYEIFRSAVVDSKLRKPYLNAVAYWVASGRCVEGDHPSQRELDHYAHLFENIYFARARLRFASPNFPYLTVLSFMVDDNPDASPGMKFFMRFHRRLRCEVRYSRYLDHYKKCVAYIKKHDRYC